MSEDNIPEKQNLNYYESLVLSDGELYEEVVIKLKVPSIKRIYDRCDYFTDLLMKTIQGDKKSEKLLASWYGTSLMFRGTSADDISMMVDGDMVYNSRKQIKNET